jgi:hypothetical protein
LYRALLFFKGKKMNSLSNLFARWAAGGKEEKKKKPGSKKKINPRAIAFVAMFSALVDGSANHS